MCRGRGRSHDDVDKDNDKYDGMCDIYQTPGNALNYTHVSSWNPHNNTLGPAITLMSQIEKPRLRKVT